ncbi:AfsR/SARP family transcriptional regulator [Arthrobacter sp. NyZ413]|uniref:AfsR/SARP family transcriptional regulator n=1 Tax=Arthrobacter sp. NyZ413 TaxID=3144669 RepID=UPI003BF7F583
MGGDSRLFQLTLLQTWQLRRDSVVVHLAARQQRLITALAIYGARRRSYLAGLLWPEHSEPNALESLRVSVHLVSKQAPGLLAVDGPVLALSESVEVDLHGVRNRIRQLREVGPDGNVASCLHLLRHADLLPDWYDDWVVYEQGRLHQDRLHAFHTIAKALMARRAYEDAVEALEAALDLEPLYESAVGMLIQTQIQQGNTAAAFHAFEKYRLKLKAEMDLDPSDAVRSLLG